MAAMRGELRTSRSDITYCAHAPHICAQLGPGDLGLVSRCRWPLAGLWTCRFPSWCSASRGSRGRRHLASRAQPAGEARRAEPAPSRRRYIRPMTSPTRTLAALTKRSCVRLRRLGLRSPRDADSEELRAEHC